jgi:hypothetical protein
MKKMDSSFVLMSTLLVDDWEIQIGKFHKDMYAHDICLHGKQSF